MNSMKQWLKQLPYLRRMLVERDRFRSERDQLWTERDRLLTEQGQLRAEIEQLRSNNALLERDKGQLSANQLYSPGHYYSPLPDVVDIKNREAQIFDAVSRELPGLNLNEAEQLKLLEQLKLYYADVPFPEEKQTGMRYYYENDYYRYSDAIFLYSMLRHLQPQRILEIGSGYSTCVMLDTIDRCFDRPISLTCIEPDPERLLALISEDDCNRINLIDQRLQEVDDDRFAELQSGDILFIDSTHVTKTGSDVNRLLFEILPQLASGVYIHFHDIFYPFEYLREWVYQGRGWNECYILRAFLQYNQAFKFVLFNTFLERFHEDWFQQHMPLCLKDLGGSLWLQKV